MTVQISRKRCTVCNAYIYLSPNVISELGTKIPLDVNGQPHDRLHGYIHRKAKEIRNTREYWDVLNAISDELEVKGLSKWQKIVLGEQPRTTLHKEQQSTNRTTKRKEC